LCDLGRTRLKPTLLGDAAGRGLDLARGLELEAELMLGAAKPSGLGVTEDEIAAYREQKFRALAQLAGVLARVNSAEANALDDGVVTNHTRQLILGDMGESVGSQRFTQKLEDVLSAGGRQVKKDVWYDPRTIIVHDVAMPIPLYYFPAVVGDIEQAYLQQAADEHRSYNLHTDFNWEKPLPNLNPRNSELSVDWSLTMLTRGLVARAIEFRKEDGLFIYTDDKGEVQKLGNNLSSLLYHLANLHETLKEAMENHIAALRLVQSAEERKQRDLELAQRFDAQVKQMYWREGRGEISREDLLDRPILRALIRILGKPANDGPSAPASGPRYDFG